MSRHNDYAIEHAASALLVLHQRRDDSNCMCGGLRLGDSWTDHVASVLAGAGLLARLPRRDEGQVAS